MAVSGSFLLGCGLFPGALAGTVNRGGPGRGELGSRPRGLCPAWFPGSRPFLSHREKSDSEGAAGPAGSPPQRRLGRGGRVGARVRRREEASRPRESSCLSPRERRACNLTIVRFLSGFL